MKLTKSKLNEMVLEALDKELNELGYEIDPDVGKNSWIHPERKKDVNQGVYLQGFSNKEARSIIDGSLQNWVKDLRKVQYRVIKDWMNKAKAGAIDYFDLVRGLKTGDVRRAHSYETDFLFQLLNKDGIIKRFRSYFGGKKGKPGYRGPS